ncbi:MAG: DNA mismatch endonuclease Vsr [Alphaproteobacteria bacterium]|nr:MAG: DNA mismatch endonuclease Vsr [Alphaproteobacteria bacterium]
MDRLSKKRRSALMARIKGKETLPERTIRSELHKRGYRFRKNYKGLPGKPDIVFPKMRKVIFVHGCFWHGHTCRKGQPPKTRKNYWLPKLLANKQRDKRNAKTLRKDRWKVLTVWGCNLKNTPAVIEKILKFLNS